MAAKIRKVEHRRVRKDACFVENGRSFHMEGCAHMLATSSKRTVLIFDKGAILKPAVKELESLGYIVIEKKPGLDIKIVIP